jgi:hypothetical protein
MTDRFGEAFDKLPSKRKRPGSEFIRRFEGLKRDSGVSDEQATHELPLNMAIDNVDPWYFDEEERRVILSRYALVYRTCKLSELLTYVS